MRIAVIGVLADSLLAFRGDMLGAMAASGHEVLALAPEQDERIVAALAGMGVGFRAIPLRRAGTNPLRDAATVAWLVRLFRGLRPDVVFVYAAKPVIYGSFAARLAGVPLRVAMITGVGSALGGGIGARRRALAWLLRQLYRAALAGTDVVFFQNPDDEGLFRELGLVGRKGQRIVRVGGSGVDLDRFSPAPLSSGPVTFLMIGRLIRDKGLAEYAEAALRVRAVRPSTRFQLLGSLDPNPSGISSAELDAMIAMGAIEYLGSTRDVRPFLANAHVGVLPSYGEGMPRSILEAMAMARPVLTTDVPGCRETVVSGVNGFLVPARDASALADAMVELVDRADELAEMGRASRKIAEERFDVRIVNRTILGAIGLPSVNVQKTSVA
ncbi:MAG: hypothetical protein QOI00_2341 [Chloroflexota bacterium]|nr:hypothetical protein [Chloroflexota bacterium]